MSSSDSEDDSFLNPTRQLKSMMNNYKVDTDFTDCNFNDSIPLDSVPTTSPLKNKKIKNISPSKKRKKSTDSCSSDSIDLETFRTLYPPINDAKPKRNTRSAAKRSVSAQNSPNLADSQKSLPKRQGRKSIANSTPMESEMAGNASQSVENVAIKPPTPPVRGRGRGRARGRARGRNNRRSWLSRPQTILDVLQSMLPPIYSVGNTDEYPDQCDNQQLFSNQNTNDVIEIEDLNETLEENELMSVKVEWMSQTIFKFDLRKYQKFTPIFEHFSREENVSYDKLYFSYNGKMIKPEDTPDSIEYSIAKFIDGGIVSQSVAIASSNENEIRNGIKLKFQCQNVKKPFEIVVGPEDKLATAMLRCAEYFEKPFDKLKFEFDGDVISGKNTPRELDLDGGGCIDVKILN